ncbi:MAG TPA: diacylglycerol kinase family protein [Gemmatimonadaceae bacterium]|nr:diacylglycerol kinase family protein [Gemmatimonadaceae bacterium]
MLLLWPAVIPAFVNPAAGNASDVDTALRKAGCFDIRAIAPDEITQAVQDALEGGAKRVAVAGGDGTVSAAAAAIARSDAELVVIPAGTFNHFARDNGIPTDLDAACANANSPVTRCADVAWVNGRLFLNTSSVGAYANFVRVRERLEPRCGYWLASGYSIVRTLVRMQPFRVRFETEGIQREYETPLVFLGVGQRELKMPLLGNRVESGKSGLHVMIVRGRTRARLLALAFAAAARGTRAMSRTPNLDAFLVERCTIEQRHSTVAVDGEVVTMDSPLDYELGAGALRLVVPALTGDRP